ncbi:MAG: hypothetical protein U9R08_03250 [Nanoarchaeota archaeon]|nr:hypothetical protein [Nanoarchaeota archaeon]
MNLLGIIQLREAGLRGPRAEHIFQQGNILLETEVGKLYKDAQRRLLTLNGFDLRKPWNTLLRKDKSEFKELRVYAKLLNKTATEMYKEMVDLGIPEDAIAFVLHEHYNVNDISYTGHATTIKHNDGKGHVIICSQEGLTECQPKMPFKCITPFNRSEMMVDETKIKNGSSSMFEEKYIQEICNDLYKLHSESGQMASQVKFMVYFRQEKLIYTDMGPFNL